LTVSSWSEPKIQAPILKAEKRKFKVEIITIPCPYLSGTVDSGNKVLLEIAEMKPIEIGYLNDF